MPRIRRIKKMPIKRQKEKDERIMKFGSKWPFMLIQIDRPCFLHPMKKWWFLLSHKNMKNTSVNFKGEIRNKNQASFFDFKSCTCFLQNKYNVYYPNKQKVSILNNLKMVKWCVIFRQPTFKPPTIFWNDSLSRYHSLNTKERQ